MKIKRNNKERNKFLYNYLNKKNIKIYDVFYFFDELDLLEIRLNMYNKLIDKFVIIDANQTFAGIPHTPLHPEKMKRFEKWKDKIIYHVVEDYPNDKELLDLTMSNSNVGAGEHYWVREFYIKESAKKALTSLNCEDDDIVFISDIDEFWNPEKIKELTDFSKNNLIRPIQQARYYYVNNRCNEENGWTGTTVCKYKMIKNGCINDIRTRSKTNHLEIKNGGWHFGFLVNTDNDRNKMVKWKHPEYNSWINTFEERVRRNQDYRGRNFTYWTSEDDLPKYLLENKDKYKKLFK